MMIKCQKCGHENQMGAIFCRGCGEKINMEQVSPEALEDARTSSGPRRAWGRTIFGLLLLAGVVGLGCAIFLPYGHTPYETPSENLKGPANSKLDSVLEGPIARARQIGFSMDEVNYLFKYRFFKEAEEASGAYAIEDVLLEDAGNGKVRITLYTKLSGRLPVLFSVVGTLKKGDEQNPFKLDLETAKVGHLPMPALQHVVTDKFNPLLDNKQIGDVSHNISAIEVKDGYVVLTIPSLTGDANVAKPFVAPKKTPTESAAPSNPAAPAATEAAVPSAPPAESKPRVSKQKSELKKDTTIDKDFPSLEKTLK